MCECYMKGEVHDAHLEGRGGDAHRDGRSRPRRSHEVAEWFADVFAGVSLTQDHDLTIHDPVVGQGVYRDVEFGTAPAYGFRLGRYFDGLPFLGLAVGLPQLLAEHPPQAAHRDGCMLVTGCGSFESHTAGSTSTRGRSPSI